MKLGQLVILVSFVLALGCLPSCKSNNDSSQSNAPSGEEEEQSAPAVPAPCEFTHASRSLVSINVETATGDCVVVVPQDVAVGELGVSVSVAGRSDVASVEIRANENAYYYANEGSVTITSVTDTGLSGEFTVSDSNPPEVGGPWTGHFEVAF